MLKEFKEFIAKGNVMDMAVGIIIGAAFTGIVNSLVKDLINPIIGLFLGGIDFSNMFFVLSGKDYPTLDQAEKAGDAVFAYGHFITQVINFLIVAFVVFLLVKAVNKARNLGHKQEEEAPAEAGPTELDVLLEIRDSLKNRA